MKSVEERFWEKVQKTDTHWIWIGAIQGQGYGNFWNGSSNVRAHRFMWELFFGPIPEGLNVCHKCDLPPCLNPEHLFLGTQAQNLQDMTVKGRRRFRSHPGEANGRAKLTEEAIHEIRTKYQGGLILKQLATEYSVSVSTIHRVVNNVGWNSVK